MTRLTLTCLLALQLISVPASRADPAHELFRLIDERLEFMQAVAAFKWQQGQPIEDLSREQVVLESAATGALAVGLVPDATRGFFKAQIAAAKEIQGYWFDIYRRGAAPQEAPDLNAVVRPRLLALGDAINRAMRDSVPITEDQLETFLTVVDVEGLSEPTKRELFLALTQVTRFEHHLAQVLGSGVLRVGTTGDYAPFSLLQPNNSFEGIDIDLARDLATAMDARVQFVKTSWPTLMADLAAGKFDIGMSGISRTTARQQVAFFSPPYYTGGKTPIVRCEDQQKYQSLEQINWPGVRVIVNPGGTNQAFARANITEANLRVFDDNTTIFEEIAGGRADVMITDAIEVRLKTSQIPSLCAAMPGKTLTYLEKAYLLPRDIYLKEFVATWLELRIADGTVEDIMNQHLPPRP